MTSSPPPTSGGDAPFGGAPAYEPVPSASPPQPPTPPPSYWGSAEPRPVGPAPGWKYGGFWIRLLAYLIDAIPIAIVSIALIVPLLGPVFDTFRDLPPPPAGAVAGDPEYDAWEQQFEQLIEQRTSSLTTSLYPVSGLLQLLSAAYFIGFWTWRGQTPGMMLLGLRVAREQDGGPPGLARSILRYVGYFISSLVLGIGFLWIAFDRRKQGWHDKIAGAVVVRPIQ